MLAEILCDGWIIRWRREIPARVRLLCLPNAGGGASQFRSWPMRLPAAVEVCAVQLPGREARLRDELFTAAVPLVDAVRTALRPLLDTPVVIFGHSMGALLGFELARQLETEGADLRALFVAACRAPHLPPRRPPLRDAADEDIIALMRKLGGTPEEVFANQELMALTLPTLRADLAVIETYDRAVPGSLTVPITALGGRADAVVGEEELAAWREHTRGPFRLCMHDGNHFFIRQSAKDVITQIADGMTLILRET
jgi:medium-chain acyl-[acyl-carrier-protein] hydrolase